MNDHEPNHPEPNYDEPNYDEPFHGFELTDEQIGQGPYQPVALELKHVFEQLASQANTAGETMFLPQLLQDALSEFLWRPSAPTLEHLLQVSPSLHAATLDIAQRKAPALVRHIPAQP